MILFFIAHISLFFYYQNPVLLTTEMSPMDTQNSLIRLIKWFSKHLLSIPIKNSYLYYNCYNISPKKNKIKWPIVLGIFVIKYKCSTVIHSRGHCLLYVDSVLWIEGVSNPTSIIDFLSLHVSFTVHSFLQHQLKKIFIYYECVYSKSFSFIVPCPKMT